MPSKPCPANVIQFKYSAESQVAYSCADILLKTGCVMITRNKSEYFTLTSGKKSPVYVDCRRLISYPKERKIIIDYAVKHISNILDINEINFIAGGETAGIPYAAWIAEALNKPMIYVRKKPKGFGKMAQIEGNLSLDNNVDCPNALLVEDMATDGGSKVLFTEAIRKTGANISYVFCPFFYDIFTRSEEIFKKNNFSMIFLTNWEAIIKLAKKESLFNISAITEVESFLQYPDKWQKENS